jgi:hypothetical protein
VTVKIFDNAGNLLATLVQTSAFTVRDSNIAPFFGFQDRSGPNIAKVTISMTNDSRGFAIDALSLDDKPELADASEPGSVIVYQKFQRGFVEVDVHQPGDTIQPRSLIELGATCPVSVSDCGVDNTVVRVEFHWVCPPQPDTAGVQFANPSGGICQENDFFVNLTVNGKVRFSPEGGATFGRSGGAAGAAGALRQRLPDRVCDEPRASGGRQHAGVRG